MEGPFRRLRWEPVDLWPGLARLWRGGTLRGLLIAVAFSLLLNSTLMVSLTWPAMMSQSIKGSLLAATAVVYLCGWLDARRYRRLGELDRKSDPQLDLFLSARGEYLQGNGPQAEQLLQRLLLQTPEDVEARLMLATLFRHERRWSEAKEQLRRLQRWSRAAAWNLEIRQEWEQLSRRECLAEQPDRQGESAEASAEVARPAADAA